MAGTEGKDGRERGVGGTEQQWRGVVEMLDSEMKEGREEERREETERSITERVEREIREEGGGATKL